MQIESNLECLSFDWFSLQENFVNKNSDPDVFTKVKSQMMKQINFLMAEAKSSLTGFDPSAFSVLHLNFQNFWRVTQKSVPILMVFVFLKRGVIRIKKLDILSRYNCFHQYKQYRGGGSSVSL